MDWTQTQTVFVFTVSPKDTTLIVNSTGPTLEGSSVSLFCRSRANPPVANYTWYKDNEEDGEDGSILFLSSVNTSHNGDYHCEAKNALGDESSATIQLDIQCKLISHIEDVDSHWQQNCVFPVCSRAEYDSTVAYMEPKHDQGPRLIRRTRLSRPWTLIHCRCSWQPQNPFYVAVHDDWALLCVHTCASVLIYVWIIVWFVSLPRGCFQPQKTKWLSLCDERRTLLYMDFGSIYM